MVRLEECSNCAYCCQDDTEEKRVRFICTNARSEMFEKHIKLAQSCTRFFDVVNVGGISFIMGDDDGEVIYTETNL